MVESRSLESSMKVRLLQLFLLSTYRKLTMSTCLETLLVTACNFISDLHTIIPIDVKCIDMEQAIPRVMKALQESVPQINPESCYRVALKYFLISQWSKYKTVYRFDPDFYEILIDTEDTNFYQANMKHLPYNCFFVPDSTGEILGTFVYVELHDEESYITSMRVVEVKDNGDIEYSCVTTPMHDKESIYSEVTKNLEDLKGWDSDVKKLPDEEVRQLALDHVLPIIQMCYYLAAQNSELQERKTKKTKRPRRKDGQPINIRQWDVGYRIGNDFRKTRPDSEDTSYRSNSRPRPHTRRAHWHHFWCGPNKSQLELKWLAPIFVNANETKNNIVSTEHLVL